MREPSMLLSREATSIGAAPVQAEPFMYWFLAYSVMLPLLEMVSTAVTQVPVTTFSGTVSELLATMRVFATVEGQEKYTATVLLPSRARLSENG